MNPASRYTTNPEKRAMFEALVDKYHTQFLQKSVEELETERANAVEAYRRYLDRRHGKVGTVRTRTLGGSGRYTVQMPVETPAESKKQRELVANFNEEHLDESMDAQARQDAAEMLLSKLRPNTSA